MHIDHVTSRRDALKLGGTAVSLAALVAACGENLGGSQDAGRVGNAPVPEPLPDYAVDDAVLLRTATSLELTAIDAYETVLGLDGVIAEELRPVIERLMENHREVADEMEQLTSSAGGEPFTCANPWFTERLLDPVFEAIQSPVVGVIQGDDAGGRVQVAGEQLDVTDGQVTTSNATYTVLDEVEVDGSGRITSIDGEPAAEGDEVRFERPVEEMAADALAFANALESFAAASHQELTLAVGITEARVAHARAAALEARHAAALAIARGGPDAFISPEFQGEEVVPAPDGQIRQFAIGSTFGLTSQIEIKAGPPDLNNVRTSYILQTPADNSFVYNELSCG